MNLLMRLTHNSLATIIAWLSTCLLAGGVSTLFSESARTMWITWGSFGLVAAVGLEVAARFRERMRMDALKLVAASRFERDMNYENKEHEANAAIRQAVARILGRKPSVPEIATSRRAKERFPCNRSVELHLRQGAHGTAGNRDTGTRVARISNLSESGFELKLTETLPQQRMEMIIVSADGGRQSMLGEVLWCSPQLDESYLAGGRFLDVLWVEGD
jgi:hypothetical protein